MKTLAELREVSRSFPFTEPIRRWKGEGRKVVGWICTYMPEELLYAAGLMPVRVAAGLEELEMDRANAYLYINTCSYARSCLERTLDRGYDFLDGLVAGSTCDGARRLFDVWTTYLPLPFMQILFVPRKYDARALGVFRQELEELKGKLEEFIGQEIPEASLRGAIALCNRTRELLRRIYDFRKMDSPWLSGAEALEIVNASFQMGREEYNALLERLIAELEPRGPLPGKKLRLMVIGSVLNNPAFIGAIEDLRGWVVTDELCSGTRYFWDPVDPRLEPLEALAQRYLTKAHCARMYPSDGRIGHILRLVKDFQVKGVISQTIRYCVPYGHDRPMVREVLEEAGVEVLELDVEYGQGGSGQIRTRVEAFIEMLEAR